MWKPALLSLFLLGALSAAAYAQARVQQPGGSYRESCRNASVRGTILFAQCNTGAGGWRDSSIDVTQCRGRDIANDRGRLVCAGGAVQPLPVGSYQQTCRNMQMTDGVLTGECQAQGGGWRASSLDTRQCGGVGISNVNGVLSCTGGSARSALPGGSYQQSCRNPTMSGATLNAECRDAAGNWRRASIDTNGCEGRDIANRFGRLACS